MAKKQAVGQVPIEITNEELVNNFIPAIDHLGNLPIKNVDIITKIVKARRSAKSVLDEYNETRKTIQEQDCLKDKDKKPELEFVEEMNISRYKYETPEIEMETTERIKELLLQKVKFKVIPIKLAALRNMEGLSANTIDSLYEFVVIE